MKIDSGAIDTVMPPHVANHFALVETDLSKSGPGFKAANGSPIKHFGQRTIKGVGDQFQLLHLTAQIADVKNTLGSVHQMVRAGNCVHFESGNCYVQHKQSGHRTPIEEKNGTFEIGIWVPKSNASVNACESGESQRAVNEQATVAEHGCAANHSCEFEGF